MHEALERLVERGQVARHERRPGQKEDRYEQLLGPTGPDTATPAGAEPAAVADTEEQAPPLTPAEDRITRLEREVAELRTELAELRSALGE